MFSLPLLLIPVSVIRRHEAAGFNTYVDSRTMYVFGIRVAYWTN